MKRKDQYTLLLPCVGKSTRYPGVRPKWMLTAPDGKLAIQHAAESVPADAVARMVIAIRAEHERAFGASRAIRRAFGDEIEILIVEEDTNGPAETVSLMLKKAAVSGGILIKDADSFFAISEIPDRSFVAVCDLRKNLDISRVGAKSFVVLNEHCLVADIVEKHVASNFISCGLYGFASADLFLNCFKSISTETHGGEIFVSHVIAEALKDGHTFLSQSVADVVDVGTLVDWKTYSSKNRLFLVDIDGVVFKNQSQFFPPYWGDPVSPIQDNVDYLLQLQSRGAQIVFVTSRPESYREITERTLQILGFAVHGLVMACAHAPRVLINDYSSSNPYPTAIAVNVPRNEPVLRALISE